jgi:hypothetical protein
VGEDWEKHGRSAANRIIHNKTANFFVHM